MYKSISLGISIALRNLVLKYLDKYLLSVAKTQRKTKCQIHKYLSTAVKESEHKVCQLGSLLFLNIFCVCSLPNFRLPCSLCQNPPTTISNCQNAPCLSVSKCNPRYLLEPFFMSSSRSSIIHF